MNETLQLTCTWFCWCRSEY